MDRLEKQMRLRTADSVIFTESAKEWLAPEDEAVASALGLICHTTFDADGCVIMPERSGIGAVPR